MCMDVCKWVHGYVCRWMDGCLYMSSYVGKWVHGFVTRWACGYVGWCVIRHEWVSGCMVMSVGGWFTLSMYVGECMFNQVVLSFQRKPG